MKLGRGPGSSLGDRKKGEKYSIARGKVRGLYVEKIHEVYESRKTGK